MGLAAVCLVLCGFFLLATCHNLFGLVWWLLIGCQCKGLDFMSRTDVHVRPEYYFPGFERLVPRGDLSVSSSVHNVPSRFMEKLAGLSVGDSLGNYEAVGEVSFISYPPGRGDVFSINGFRVAPGVWVSVSLPGVIDSLEGIRSEVAIRRAMTPTVENPVVQVPVVIGEDRGTGFILLHVDSVTTRYEPKMVTVLSSKREVFYEEVISRSLFGFAFRDNTCVV